VAWACIDGNEAVARIAHRLTEVIAIYPITPASPMGELADVWSARAQPNLWGTVPEVIEMQSEAGAAGALHGALLEGALGTTFTASQGLLLMIPDLFKIAGELLPAVVHVAARAVATHALSIFGDHSDVMAARSTGCAMLASSSVQEAHDLALVAHAASLRARIPFLHFFDGFRTSHEVAKVALLEDQDLAALIDEQAIDAHRRRRLDPDRPELRGSAQNPDVFFQAREAANPFYDAVPETVQRCMDELAARTGRAHRLVDRFGSPDAERAVVLMGSGVGAAQEAVERRAAAGEREAVVAIRLFRPFPKQALLEALPPTVRQVAVLDRTKEPGAPGEPLYQDVVTTLAEALAGGARKALPRLVGGRYGLGSKEFTPAMVAGVLDALRDGRAPQPFTVGIVDDVTHRSLPYDPAFRVDPGGGSALFFGVGADGTVGAAQSTVRILGEETELHAQGYFVYDSKKSGSITVSHVRFGPKPIRSTYLVDRADFVSCHHPTLLERIDVLGPVAEGATFLLNTPHAADAVWDHLPREVQEAIVEKALDFYVVDAQGVAESLGLGSRINTIMQPCFFALSELLPRERALAAIVCSIEKTYAKRGPAVVERNVAAVHRAQEALTRVRVPARADATRRRCPPVPEDAGDFVARVTACLLAGEGDGLPVSALPPGGAFPTGTARYEKRALARELPVWDPELCIDCGKCAAACPHAAIRAKVFEPERLADAPEEFRAKPFRDKEMAGRLLSIQVAPADCTGCGVCVDVCPARSKEAVKHKALEMEPAELHREVERASFEFFLSLPELPREALPSLRQIKHAQLLEPLFEFSGACAGCGETPYLKLLSQLFGDRMIVANATGCSSIFGGNLPTTPWSTNAAGRGPAWANSLFEDNAEFGLGILLALELHQREARRLLEALAPRAPEGLARAILDAPQDGDAAIAAQREHVAALEAWLRGPGAEAPGAARLLALTGDLVRKSVWIVGGDGWAYDIGAAGLDHVLASGRKVNVLVLDTQVYSNTGGQASKATPRAAVAKFASSGKSVPRKDLGTIASAYGHVYVAQVALGADDRQTLHALLEADAWDGPSLVIAYSTCIAHGIDMARSMAHQGDAVRSGFWPLYRYHPGADPHQHPLQVDSRRPTLSLDDFARQEARFAMLARSDPARAARLLALAQADANERWRLYEQLAGIERTVVRDEE
jgi:pyruvate-ferredoxin/flavodoxin oxidoreductase